MVPARLKAPSFRLRKSASVVFSPEGRFLAQIGPRVIVWDVAARKVASEFKVIPNEWDVAFSPDEGTLAVKGSNGQIMFCDALSGSVISGTQPSPANGNGCKPVFLSDGKHLLDGSWEGDLRILEIATAKEVDKHCFGTNYMFGTLVACQASSRIFAALKAKAGQGGGSRLLMFASPLAMNRYEEIPPATRAQAAGRGWRQLEHLSLSPDGKSAAVFMLGQTLQTPNTIEAFRLDGSASSTAVLESRQHHVHGLGWSRAGFVAASIRANVKTETPGFNAWLQATKSGVHEHVYFFAAESMRLAQRWPWPDAWSIAFDPATDSIAIASRGQSGAFIDVKSWFPGTSALNDIPFTAPGDGDP